MHFFLNAFIWDTPLADVWCRWLAISPCHPVSKKPHTWRPLIYPVLMISIGWDIHSQLYQVDTPDTPDTPVNGLSRLFAILVPPFTKHSAGPIKMGRLSGRHCVRLSHVGC